MNGLESKRHGRGRTSSWVPADGAAHPGRSSVLAVPVAGLTRQFRCLLGLLGTLLLRELLARGDGVLLGPPLGFGRGLQAATLQHLFRERTVLK